MLKPSLNCDRCFMTFAPDAFHVPPYNLPMRNSSCRQAIAFLVTFCVSLAATASASPATWPTHAWPKGTPASVGLDEKRC